MKSKCGQFVATEDSADQNHVLHRPLQPMELESLIPALYKLTEAADVKGEGAFEIGKETRESGTKKIEVWEFKKL
jgi:hypothetical protein